MDEAVDGAVVPCSDLDAAITFLTEELGFRLDTIMPADDPAVAVISGHGLRMRLTRPGAGVVTTVPTAAPSFELSRANDDDSHVGRAGMRYRDLLPSRQGGRVIASHIVVPDGGPVADYVHFHDVASQVIYCLRGWARLVYEDQGPPFVFHEGDCVLQPPGIRHRVLETSPGFEVVEITAPAEHPTHVEHQLTLPTAQVDATREFGGQRFVHHVAATADWLPWKWSGFEFRDTGVGAATAGRAAVYVVRATEPGASTQPAHEDGVLAVWYIASGRARLTATGQSDHDLGPGDAFAVPSGVDYELGGCSGDLELLEITLAGA